MAKSRPGRILMVEDNPSDRALVEGQLAQSKLKVTLESEETLAAAVEHLSRVRFDVILVDLSLPDSQGLDTFKRIHAVASSTPVIVLTGREDADLALQALREGAQDYLLKSKIDADTLARSVRYAVERMRRQHAENELSSVGKIQRHLLQGVAPSVRDFDVYGRCKPATFVGGDFFDFFSMGANQLGVVIADAAGHGIASGITMSETRAVIRAFSTVTDDVGEILTRASAILQWDLTKETFVAAFLARIALKERTLHFAAAGHTGFILDATGRNKQVLNSDDPPLGMDARVKYKVSPQIRLSVGDALFLFTDGFLEAANSEGEQFGRRRVFEVVRERRGGGAGAMCDYLFEQTEAFKQGAPSQDDMTAAIVIAAPHLEDSAEGDNDDDEDEDEYEFDYDSEEQTQTKVGTEEQAKSDGKPVEAVAHEELEYFEVDKLADVAVLQILEREILSSRKCADMLTELIGYLEVSKPSRVVLSFQNVEKLSSEGINMCLKVKAALMANDARLHLCGLRPHVRDAFRALNLDTTVFEIHDDLGKAISSF